MLKKTLAEAGRSLLLPLRKPVGEVLEPGQLPLVNLPSVANGLDLIERQTTDLCTVKISQELS